ncbi:P27 family phage terminase small subunit [Lactococcus garvieae]|uniref:P27 family phage terminase small subunit n=1 Tax=Lactococcus garvieae TaxID=1363 RepID=UPI0030CD2939
MYKRIPSEKSIYDDTISKMKKIGTYNTAFNRLVRIYAGMVKQYYDAVQMWEKEGSPILIPSASDSMKKHPALDQIEKLRKDILSYSNQLMLNPKSQKDSEAKTKEGESAFSRFLSQNGGGGSG